MVQNRDLLQSDNDNLDPLIPIFPKIEEPEPEKPESAEAVAVQDVALDTEKLADPVQDPAALVRDPIEEMDKPRLLEGLSMKDPTSEPEPGPSSRQVKEETERDAIIQQMIKDPLFLQAPVEDQRRKLIEYDPLRFGALNTIGQNKLLDTFIEQPIRSPITVSQRLMLSFAGGPENTVRALEQQLGEGNAIDGPRGIAIRDDSESPWVFIDEEGWTIGDLADRVGGSLVTVGAMAGSLSAGFNPSTWWAAPRLAALGAVGGEILQYAIGRGLGVQDEKEWSELGLDVGAAGLIEGGLETTAGIGAKVAGRGLNLAKGKVLNQARRAIDFLAESGFPDLSPTVAQATGGPIWAFLESAAQGGFAGGRLTEFTRKTREATKEIASRASKAFVDRLLPKMATKPEAVFDALGAIVRREIKLDEAAGAGLRDKIVKKIGKTVQIPKKVFNDISDKISSKELDNIISSRGIKRRRGGALNFEDAITVRSELLAIQRKATQAHKAGIDTAYNLGDISEAIGIIDKAMRKKLRPVSRGGTMADPSLLQDWNMSQLSFKRMYSKKTVERLVLEIGNNPNAASLMDVMTVKELKDTRRLLGQDNPAFNVLSSIAGMSAIDRSLTEGGKDMLATTFKKKMMGAGDVVGILNKEKALTLFGKKGAQEYEQIINLLDVQQKIYSVSRFEPGVFSGGAAVKLLQIGAAVEVANDPLGFGAPGRSMAFLVLAFPPLFGRAMANKRMRTVVLNGLKAETENKMGQAASAVARLLQLDKIALNRMDEYTDSLLADPHGDKAAVEKWKGIGGPPTSVPRSGVRPGVATGSRSFF
jgi:hypothetical protein